MSVYINARVRIVGRWVRGRLVCVERLLFYSDPVRVHTYRMYKTPKMSQPDNNDPVTGDVTSMLLGLNLVLRVDNLRS